MANFGSKEGVTVTFVHTNVIDRLGNLERQTGKAASIKPDFTQNKEGVAILRDCISLINAALKNPAKTIDNEAIESKEDQSSFTSSYR